MPATLSSATRDDMVVRALSDLERMFSHGQWLAGRRHLAGSWCLIGGIDAATARCHPDVRAEATRALVAELPLPMRWVGSVAPRASLMAYNDYVGRQRGVLRLLRSALARLTDGDAPATELRTLLADAEQRPQPERPPVRIVGTSWR